MWPMPPVLSTASRAARRTPSSGPRSTHGSTLPCSAMRGPTSLAHRREIHAPIHAQHVRAGFRGGREQMAGSLGVEDHRRFAGANFLDQELRRGQGEFAVLLEGQLSHPGVKKLHGSSARGNLRSQIAGRGARNAFEQVSKQIADRSTAWSSPREIRPCRGPRSCSRPASTARPRNPAPARSDPVREPARESSP